MTVRSRCHLRILAGALLCGLVAPGEIPAVSIAKEAELGKTFGLEARARLPLIRDVEVNRYVNRIGHQIVDALGTQPFHYQFFVVRDPRINAFAVPGGYVYVHAGLLTRARNDDEVAGVLGHEIAHVNAHHLSRQQEAMQLLNYATLLGVLLSVVQPAIGAGAVAASATAQLKYRRDFEQEADYLGVRYMRQAGYDPRGMLDFFKTMLDEQRTTPTFAPPYLLSHPLTETRLTNLEAVLRTPQWDTRPRRPATLELERVQLLTRTQTELPQDVMVTYRRRVEAAPTSGSARYLLGLVYLETGDLDSARESFEGARQLGFDDVDRELGRTCLRQRQLAKARELLSRATEIHPADPVAHRDLAKVLAALQDPAGAMREYERALQLAPDLEEAHYSLGMLAGRAGRQGEGFYHLAMAFKLRGEFGKALSQFEKAAPLAPDGSDRARQIRAEIDELSAYLRQAGTQRR